MITTTATVLLWIIVVSPSSSWYILPTTCLCTSPFANAASGSNSNSNNNSNNNNIGSVSSYLSKSNIHSQHHPRSTLPLGQYSTPGSSSSSVTTGLHATTLPIASIVDDDQQLQQQPKKKQKRKNSVRRIVSQLFFNNVLPLLRAASTRQLTVDDVLVKEEVEESDISTPEIRPTGSSSIRQEEVQSSPTLSITTTDTSARTTNIMSTVSVVNNNNRLQHIYNSLMMKNLQEQKANVQSGTSSQMTEVLQTTSNINVNPTVVLLQALFIHQRRMLIITGLLRLVNTIIQAFPAILISKLLRYIEAGTVQPIYKSLRTASILVLLLTIKMIIENQYFHYLIHISTNVRNSLCNMIFTKSLYLQQGGSNIIRMDNSLASSDSFNTNNTSTTSTPGSSSTVKDDDSTATSSSSSSAAAIAASTTLGVGGVINLMQSDTGIIESAAMQFHTLWDGPLQIAIYTTLLFQYLGSSVLYGIAVLLCTIPVNSIALRILNKLSKYENEAKDARTKRTTESINQMKLLKLLNWENQFADDIRYHRSKEIQHFISRGYIRAANSAISNAIPAVVLVVTLTAYVRTGRPIVASTIFTAISLFNQLRFPLFFYPLLIDSAANGRNAMRRIASFLSANEIVPYVQYRDPCLSSPSSTTRNSIPGCGGSIEMKNGNFLWSMLPTTSEISTNNGAPNRHEQSQNETATMPTLLLPPPAVALSNINIKINPGEVVAVIGSVGSGKSALIKGMLGELNPIVPSPHSHGTRNDIHDENPHVISHGNIAYCSQEAWLPKGSLRDAILFGREYDEERYLNAIYDAGLNDDLTPPSTNKGTDATSSGGSGALSHNTDVGEGGSSLSGGQRARVALARALYSADDTKVFLLDDCLAALDTRVGSTVFDRITKRLRKSNAATLLVTNDPSIPRRCDRVILMGSVAGSTTSSTIVDVGSYDELLSRGHDLRGITTSEDKIDDTQGVDTQSVPTASYQNDTLAHTAASSFASINAQDKRMIDETMDCSYGDCETQLTMQNCPDSIADQVGSKRITNNDRDLTDEYILRDHICIADDGISGLNSTANESVELAEKILMPETRNVLSKGISSIDESMSKGAVPPATYLLYLRSVGSPFLVVAMFAAYLLSNGAQFFQQYTVAKWTEVGGNAMGSAVGLGYLQRLIYAAGVVSVFLWIRSVLTMQVGVRASTYLHSKMLSSVFAAPMSFFDATPSGQLLSRFGKEIETVDKGVPDSIASVLFCFLQIFMSAGALAGILSSGMALPLGLVGVLYVQMMSRFRPAARDMKRVETKTRSPIYTNFGEAIRGAEVIRSVRGASAFWSQRHQDLFDTNIRVYHTVKALDRWLSTRLETLGNVVVFASAVASIILTRSGQLKAGSAGWGLTQALAITGLLTWAVRCLTDLESNMMSVMRVKELTDLDSETVDVAAMIMSSRNLTSPKEVSDIVPLLPHTDATSTTTFAPLESQALVKSGWPWLGNVEFRNVSMRYSSSTPLVLKNVNLSIPAGTTLGIVGRSGSGKSSLLLTLFRLSEIESDVGSIEIDGVDIRSVSISTLRQSLAIIPQDPFLFTGSLAYNLDATGTASEADMLQALEITSPELAESFRRGDGLATTISNSLLSVGERQLICLARALLRKSKILVLDEATSSVDPKTDREVQETIRREFVDRGVTVITVAHRLDTVLSYDRIAVLGDGKLLEYGPPNELIAIPGGELQKLVLADRLSKLKGSKKILRNEGTSANSLVSV